MSRGKVVLLTTSFPLVMGGDQSPFVAELARGWLEQGYSVDVVVPSHPFQDFQWDKPGLRIHPVDYANPRSAQCLAMGGGGVLVRAKSQALLQAPTMLSRMIDITLQQAASAKLIHACWFGPSLVAHWVSRKTGVPWGVTALGSDVDRLLLRGTQWFWRSHARSAAFVSATSSYLAQKTEQAIGRHVVWWPLGVDLQRFTPRSVEQCRTQLDWPGAPFTALLLGRWISIKGQEWLLSLWPEVLSRVPGARLILAGYGPDEERLKSLRSRLGLEDAVELVTYPRELLPEAFNAADVVLVPSRREGLGMVAIEGMASGKPVLVSDVGGLPDVLGAENRQWVLPPSSPEAWIEAIVSLANDPSARARLGKALRDRAESLFYRHVTSDAMARHLQEITL